MAAVMVMGEELKKISNFPTISQTLQVGKLVFLFVIGTKHMDREQKALPGYDSGFW